MNNLKLLRSKLSTETIEELYKNLNLLKKRIV